MQIPAFSLPFPKCRAISLSVTRPHRRTTVYDRPIKGRWLALPNPMLLSWRLLVITSLQAWCHSMACFVLAEHESISASHILQKKNLVASKRSIRLSLKGRESRLWLLIALRPMAQLCEPSSFVRIGHSQTRIRTISSESCRQEGSYRVFLEQ